MPQGNSTTSRSVALYATQVLYGGWERAINSRAISRCFMKRTFPAQMVYRIEIFSRSLQCVNRKGVHGTCPRIALHTHAVFAARHNQMQAEKKHKRSFAINRCNETETFPSLHKWSYPRMKFSVALSLQSQHKSVHMPQRSILQPLQCLRCTP
ncbi:hypothetical protein AVEN_100111-1 [Araneus ventricosus]|uniref:Uncharacterized protein n=1 Tax=Araneus ventricosus TaxID=182803 RepID=A0A4Y2V951_ARAVE|nr:hypothetical protein AVEN_100111-1 [Araneus ventricosus]